MDGRMVSSENVKVSSIDDCIQMLKDGANTYFLNMHHIGTIGHNRRHIGSIVPGFQGSKVSGFLELWNLGTLELFSQSNNPPKDAFCYFQPNP